MKGKAVKLTALCREDSSVLYRWINDRETVLYNSAYRPVGEESHEEWFRRIQADPSTVFFAIRLLEGNQLIGTCQLINIHPIHRTAELQIRLGDPSIRGKGYGTEAIGLLTGFAFSDLNLNRVFLNVFSDNHTARRVYEKSGFVIEGELRQAAYIKGAYQSITVMGLLKEDHLGLQLAREAAAVG